MFRFINRDGKNFVKEFQPQISAKIGVILKDYFNKYVNVLFIFNTVSPHRAIASTEASYLIE